MQNINVYLFRTIQFKFNHDLLLKKKIMRIETNQYL